MAEEHGKKRKRGIFGWGWRKERKETPSEAAPEPAAEDHAEPEDAAGGEGEAIPAEAAPEAETGAGPDAAAGAEIPPEAETPPAEEAPRPGGFFSRLRKGLSRSSGALSENIAGLITKARLDEETLDDLEDVLVSADLGVDSAHAVREKLARRRLNKDVTAAEVRAVVAEEIAETLQPVEKPLELDAERRPHVMLVVGVNGTGKTTTIGKLAESFREQGQTVWLAACDTFRAAAIDQLKIWGERTGAPVIARAPGADAAGLAYDALEQAREAGADVLLIDTAGRLQNKATLMDELAKVVRVLKKLDESAPHDVLLVLDATTGQNALSQVEAFREIAGVTGLVMTKLDGTAKGGILVAIARKFGLPVHAVGVGEGVEDLQPFDADEFARALAGGEQEREGAAAE
ncbi:MAG: signal recognition particle-docking protein FtsY [Alphaproteobacteria bacterium]